MSSGLHSTNAKNPEVMSLEDESSQENNEEMGTQTEVNDDCVETMKCQSSDAKMSETKQTVIDIESNQSLLRLVERKRHSLDSNHSLLQSVLNNRLMERVVKDICGSLRAHQHRVQDILIHLQYQLKLTKSE